MPTPSYSYQAAIVDVLREATINGAISANGIRRILAAHGLPEDPDPVDAFGMSIPKAPVDFITEKQKVEVIRLLNHPEVSRATKTKTLLSINKMTQNEADQIIAELRQLPVAA